MRKRITSLLLAFCLFISVLPINAIAAWTQEEEALYLQMLELGLVDADGALIENNSFTVEDGTKLASLTELENWLAQCDEDDFTTVITVDATGKSATAEQIAYALSLEHDINDLADQLNLLASGDGVALLAATNTIDTTAHQLSLDIIGSRNFDSDTVSLSVFLKNGSNICAAPSDIVIEVGVFAEFLQRPDGGCGGELDISVDGSENIPGAGYFKEITIAKGQTNVEFKLDMSKIRNYIKTSGRDDIWDGNVYALFEARAVSGMPESCDYAILALAPEAETSDTAKVMANGFTPNVFNSNSDKIPYIQRLEGDNEEVEETIDNKKVDTFTLPTLRAYQGYNLMDVMEMAVDNGVGDAIPMWRVEDFSIITTYTNESYSSVPDLYFQDGNTLVEADGGASMAQKRNLSSDSEYIKKVAAYYNNSWTYSESNKSAKDLYYVLYDGLAQTIRYHYVKMPVYEEGETNTRLVMHEHKLHMQATDWNTTQNDLQGICVTGNVYLNDDVAPTVVSITTDSTTFSNNESKYYPGNVIPITVTFSEPVYGDYALVYQRGDKVETLLNQNTSDSFYKSTICRDDANNLSKTRTFYYVVRDTDGVPEGGKILVKGVQATTTNCKDSTGNDFINSTTDTGGIKYQELSAELVSGKLFGTRYADSIVSMSAQTYETEPDKVTVRIDLNDDNAFKTLWANAANSETFVVADATLVIDGDTATKYPLTLKEENNHYYLTSTITLPYITDDVNRLVELYLNDNLYYGACATFLQKPIRDADSTAYTINTSAWPSGLSNIVYIQDEDTPVFTYVDNGTDFTYKSNDQIYWESSDESVFKVVTETGTGDDLTLKNSTAVSLIATGEGTATLKLRAKNNGGDDVSRHTDASAPVTITVKDGGSPSMLFPRNANTIFARQNSALNVSFASNLAKYEIENGKITAELFEGSYVQDNATAIWTQQLDSDKTSLVIPENTLKNISRGDEPTYILRLTATAIVDGQKAPLKTEAKIVVRSLPAEIKLTGLDNTLFTSRNIDIGWDIANFDLKNNADVCQFQFTVEKDGEVVDSITELSNQGTYTLKPTVPENLKDYYVITAKAKNGTDPTWSIASSTITVYEDGALELVVDGEKVESDTVTLKNTITGETTTDPTVVNNKGETLNGLNDAQSIAALRSELGLMDSISINYEDVNWSALYDMIEWKTTTGQNDEITDELERAVTVNYRYGMLYQPLEKLTYTKHVPQTVMMLCGLRDGSNNVTASHSALNELSDTIKVNVERLENKLYLFQFTPAVKTEISYIDGNSKQHTIYTNDDGSLALFEPNGIASDINAASVSDDVAYRGTVSEMSLKSGEGNGTLGELYPLNSIELRKAATAQITLLKPNGKPLANTNVTLRGGVYRNSYAADNRDDAYCAGAMFAKQEGQVANLDGKIDQVFTTDENGVLSVHMDLQQFTSENDPSAVGVGDALEFVFELRFANDSYYPEIVTVNGSLTQRDAMRSGDNIVTLTTAQKAKPFVAEQTVSYTGRKIDVRRHTGVLGPSANYPEAQLNTSIMLWGVDDVDLNDTGYNLDLREQGTAISLPEQERFCVDDASYPFSSIPLLSSNVLLTSQSFIRYNATQKTSMEAAMYNANNKLIGTIAFSFGIIDLTAIEKVEDAPSLVSLMANIAAYGSVGGANTKYGLVNTVSDAFMNDALSFIEDMGGETGLVKAILMPTEDPTRYDAYLWTGLNTTKLEDLDYDTNGIALELNYIGQDYDSLLGQVNDTFTLSDFQAMADGSYFDDRSSLYGAASSAVGLPIMLVMEGWLNAEIRYNFDKGQWEVLTTGGGFTAGAQLEYEKAFNMVAYGIPLTASFKVRGGATVNFETAIRYAEQLGLEWNDDTANTVNDYLTTLRINAYLELFGGLGRHEESFVAKIGAFSTIEINNENRFLTRKYLKDPSKRDMDGQFLRLDGELGFKVVLGLGPISTEITLASVTYGKGWDFPGWNEINDYWDEATSGLGSSWMDEDFRPQSVMSNGNDVTMVVADAAVRLQSRDYLNEGKRVWTGDESGIATMSLDEQNRVAMIETNSYPFSNPLISDDGSILVYLSDAESEDVTDVEVRYSLSNGGGFPNGIAIPTSADGFTGHGDSSLDFDGTADFAGAAWLREAASVGLKAGSELNDSQQRALLNGLEVVASIWNGSEWTTTRLTNNGTEDVEPVIAVNENGQAIVAWRSVQTGSSIHEYTENRILFKVFDGTSWSNETYTLYNGSTGSVNGMNVEMLSDGTAAVAFTINDNEDGGEIYYSVVNINAENIEDDVKTIRATTNDYIDEKAQLTTVDEYFVLGWSSIQDRTGVEQHDVGLKVFDKSGAPQAILPESLSRMVSTSSFDGRFTFVKGAESLGTLSILWNDSGAGDESNDVIRAIKFDNYGGNYGASAPIKVAELPANTRLDHMSAYTTSYDGTGIQAIIQGTTYSQTEFETVNYSYEVDGVTYEGTGKMPKETVNLYSATENYTDSVEVTGTNVDFNTLNTNSYVSVQFAITNQGMNIMNSVTVSIEGAEDQTFTGINLLPGETKTISVVIRTGDEIENMDYKVTATFDGTGTRSATGTVYLDYPDVGISALTVVKEQEGTRNVLVSMYNQSAASLNKADRRVKLGVYSDPECETPVNGKYFADGTADTAYEITLTGDALAAIDEVGYTQEISFDMETYMADSGLTEIPYGGVTLFIKAQIQQQVNGNWIELPEADVQNNQKSITFDSLLIRSGNVPTTFSVEIDNADTTTAFVNIKNNSMQPIESGKLLAALLDENGEILESKNIGNIELGCEGVEEFELKFSKSGERVVLRYGENSQGDNTNANADSITLTGLQLSLDSFDANGNATVETVHNGNYLLTVIPEHVGATVSVDGEPIENGMKNIVVDGKDKTITITITAADGIATRTYKINLKFAIGDINGDYRVTNADLIAFARYLVELVEFSDEQMALADFDGNGELNNTDLILLARYIVG